MAEQCLEERDGSDGLVARFTYSPGYIDAVAVQERDLNDDDDFSDTNEVVYYQANTLFSVYALSDGDGSVVEGYRYDAYGGCTVLDADGSADADGLSDVKNPYTFTGRRLDAELGLMQYRHRYYSVALGRFVSRDPVGYTDTHNLYAFVANRPTLANDPTGLGVISCLARLIALNPGATKYCWTALKLCSFAPGVQNPACITAGLCVVGGLGYCIAQNTTITSYQVTRIENCYYSYWDLETDYFSPSPTGCRCHYRCPSGAEITTQGTLTWFWCGPYQRPLCKCYEGYYSNWWKEWIFHIEVDWS